MPCCVYYYLRYVIVQVLRRCAYTLFFFFLPPYRDAAIITAYIFFARHAISYAANMSCRHFSLMLMPSPYLFHILRLLSIIFAFRYDIFFAMIIICFTPPHCFSSYAYCCRSHIFVIFRLLITPRRFMLLDFRSFSCCCCCHYSPLSFVAFIATFTPLSLVFLPRMPLFMRHDAAAIAVLRHAAML